MLCDYNMKNTLIIILFLLLISSSNDKGLPLVENNAFQLGEKLRYRISYGIIDAGEATLEIRSTERKVRSRNMFHIVGKGKTLGAFNSFYKVMDRYESYIDKKGVFPWYFKRRVNEGGYKINQDYSFKHHYKKVHTGDETFKIPIGIQDMISSFYYARTLDFNNIYNGKIFEFNCFMDNEIYSLKIKYVGKEKITIRKGKFNCLKFVPVVQTGRYFNSEDDVNFWITNDKNKIPVLVKAKIPVGTVRLHLVGWEGLKNRLESKIK